MFEEASKDEKWVKAMDQEIDSIKKNDTWELVDLPQGKKPIGVKWVYKTKLNAQGEVEKYKARLGNEETKVCRLKKALYGLKQAPRAWYSRIDAFFQEYGFHKCPYEHTLYTKKNSQGEILIVCLYVDDLIFTGSNAQMCDDFKMIMSQRFEM
ncbi:unnamed protein product [Prunus brigantina]